MNSQLKRIEKDVLDEIVQTVKTIPIVDVVNRVIPLTKRGANFYGICPFHEDTSKGSFVVSEGKGIWKCFACPDSPGGDAIGFVAKYYDINPMKAILWIAQEFGLASFEDEVKVRKQAIQKAPVKKVEKEAIAPAETLDTVYRLFINAASLEDSDREYLQGRHVPEKRLNQFFSFPQDEEKAIKQLLTDMEAEGLDGDVLKHVPGFFWRTKDKRWGYMKVEGIGFGIKDTEGRTIRIQIRSKATDKKQRYIWFSSAFVQDYKHLDHGTGSGSPIHVERPKKQKHSVIAVTEGKFKSLVLSELNLLTLSMQGISCWKKILPVVETLRKEEAYQDPEIWLCYDNDVVSNENVKASAQQLQKALEEKGFTVLYAIWDQKYGKGIDDVVNNGHIKEITKVSNI